MIVVHATIRIRPGTLDEVFEHAWPSILETRKEPGCISYDLTQSLTDKDSLVFVERWTNRDSLEAHFTSAHMRKWREAAKSCVLSRKVEIIEGDVVDIL